MIIKEFNYAGSKRVVAVFEETPTSIKGVDLGKITDQKDVEAARKLCESLSIDKKSNRLTEEDYERSKHLMKHYRNFNKSKIETI